MLNLTYNTPNPHGRVRDLLIDAMLDALGEDDPPPQGEKKNFEKSLKNPLTKTPRYGIIQSPGGTPERKGGTDYVERGTLDAGGWAVLAGVGQG